MIFYSPTGGDVRLEPRAWRPKTCFLMTQLGAPLPKQLRTIRTQIQRTLVRHDFELIDANRFTTGKDFLEKIWDLICSVPVGIAVLHEDMGARTTANIFYELGLMQAYGKETLIVKTEQAAIPSDFIRTEYVVYRTGFARKLRQFMGELEERARYYETVASGLDENPLLAIDYLRRAYLLTGETSLQRAAAEVFDTAGLGARAKNSVETLLAGFARR